MVRNQETFANCQPHTMPMPIYRKKLWVFARSSFIYLFANSPNSLPLHSLNSSRELLHSPHSSNSQVVQRKHPQNKQMLVQTLKTTLQNSGTTHPLPPSQISVKHKPPSRISAKHNPTTPLLQLLPPSMRPMRPPCRLSPKQNLLQ